jgi:hypothetical protein
MPQRQCTKADVTSLCKRITLPITLEKYEEIIGDHGIYRKWVDEMIVQYPELFPAAIREGYTLHDERGSEKLAGLRLRRICLKVRDCEGKKQVFMAPTAPRRAA